MNYASFEELEHGTMARRENEPEQRYMERVFRAACQNEGFCGPDTPCSIYRINDMLAPEFVSCSAETPALTLSFSVREWMLNPKGTLHGGIMATMLDMTIGMLIRFSRKTNHVSTVSLSLNYLRPVHEGVAVVCARIRKAGRNVVFAEAKLIDGQSQLCTSAIATFM